MRRGVARPNGGPLEGGLDQLFKADLHMHTRYSGPVKHLRFFRARDCYSQPLEVYRRAKRRGMDLVTITDHDSIDGCLELLNKLGDLPGFVMGEEVSAYLPRFRHTVHIGVYGHNEAQHRDIQRLRSNGEELAVEVLIDPVGTGEEETVTASVRDISERKRVQADLEQSEQRFRSLVEKSWSGMAFGSRWSLRLGTRSPSARRSSPIVGKPPTTPARRTASAPCRPPALGPGWRQAARGCIWEANERICKYGQK